MLSFLCIDFDDINHSVQQHNQQRREPPVPVPEHQPYQCPVQQQVKEKLHRPDLLLFLFHNPRPGLQNEVAHKMCQQQFQQYNHSNRFLILFLNTCMMVNISSALALFHLPLTPLCLIPSILPISSCVMPGSRKMIPISSADEMDHLFINVPASLR